MLSRRHNNLIGRLGEIDGGLIFTRYGRGIVVEKATELHVGARAAHEFDMAAVLNFGQWLLQDFAFVGISKVDQAVINNRRQRSGWIIGNDPRDLFAMFLD